MHLKAQHSIFRTAATVSGMHLKPAKCFLIVSVVELTVELRNKIKQWLALEIPDWQDFNIVAAGREYKQLSYEKPYIKYFSRVEELASSTSPSLPTIIRYNERVVTVFTYIAQVVAVPDASPVG